jgi:hypothetical protein
LARHPQVLTLDHGIEPEAGVADRLFDGNDQALVPDIDGERAGLRHADGGNLVQGCVGAVGLDHHLVQQTDAGAAGAQGGKLLLQRDDGPIHPVPVARDIGFFSIGHDGASSKR